MDQWSRHSLLHPNQLQHLNRNSHNNTTVDGAILHNECFYISKKNWMQNFYL